MTDSAISAFLPADDPRLGVLHSRVALLCHTVRVAAAAWYLWGLGTMIWILSDRPAQLARLAKVLEFDPQTISNGDYWSAVSVAIFGAALSAPLVYFIWRLTRAYLDGRIFTVESAMLLRNIGVAGFFATAAGVVTPPVSAALFSFDVLRRLRLYDFVSPSDLLYFFISAFVFALGAILKTAAEIAEDNRQIV
jgi:hypothetical protein